MHVVDEEVAVPSFRRRASVMDDAKSVAQSPQQDAERSADATEALALAEEAEAEAAEAEAVAAAARARAKAIRLRKQAGESTVEAADAEPDVEESDAEPLDIDEAEAEAKAAAEADSAPVTKKSRRLRVPRIRWGIVAAVLAILCISALVTLSVLMVLNHREQTREQARTAEYTAAARQSVVTLMSLDFNSAQEDVQRIIDNTTGQFREDFEAQAEAFTQVARDSKVVTEVSVNVAAIKSSTDNSATALVSATSRVTNSAGANQEPRSWRLMVDLVREGDQIKMAKVEFVP